MNFSKAKLEQDSKGNGVCKRGGRETKGKQYRDMKGRKTERKMEIGKVTRSLMKIVGTWRLMKTPYGAMECLAV